jgi:hypothetical protein
MYTIYRRMKKALLGTLAALSPGWGRLSNAGLGWFALSAKATSGSEQPDWVVENN